MARPSKLLPFLAIPVYYSLMLRTSDQSMRRVLASCTVILCVISAAFGSDTRLQKQMISLTKTNLNINLAQCTVEGVCSRKTNPYHLSLAELDVRPDRHRAALPSHRMLVDNPYPTFAVGCHSTSTGSAPTCNYTFAQNPSCSQTSSTSNCNTNSPGCTSTPSNCTSSSPPCSPLTSFGGSPCATSESACTQVSVGCEFTAQSSCANQTIYPACATASSANCSTASSGTQCTSTAGTCPTVAPAGGTCAWTVVSSGDCGSAIAGCTTSSSCLSHTVYPACGPQTYSNPPCNTITSANSGGGSCFQTYTPQQTCQPFTSAVLCSTGSAPLCQPLTSTSQIYNCTVVGQPLCSPQTNANGNNCSITFAPNGSNCSSTFSFSCMNTQAGGSNCSVAGACSLTYGYNCYTTISQGGACYTNAIGKPQCFPTATALAENIAPGTELLPLALSVMMSLFGLACVVSQLNRT